MASEFLLAYRELIRLAESNPVDLAARAQDNAVLQEACDRVRAAATGIWITEHFATARYAENVPSYEIAARRDYDARWRHAVSETDRLLAPVLSSLKAKTANPDRDVQAERIDTAIEIGTHRAAQLEGLIDYGRDRVDNAVEWDEFEEMAYSSVSAWDDLRIRSGFNPAAVLARLELVPFVLIPSDISKMHGSTETISLFERLGDAQRAFIFGCDLACAALQRSILEDTLRRNYHAEGRDLYSRIEAAVLPWGLKPSDLHSIRMLGNDVLHAAKGSATEGLVRRVVAGLDALQKLIEGAPSAGAERA